MTIKVYEVRINEFCSICGRKLILKTVRDFIEPFDKDSGKERYMEKLECPLIDTWWDFLGIFFGDHDEYWECQNCGEFKP